MIYYGLGSTSKVKAWVRLQLDRQSSLFPRIYKVNNNKTKVQLVIAIMK